MTGGFEGPTGTLGPGGALTAGEVVGDKSAETDDCTVAGAMRVTAELELDIWSVTVGVGRTPLEGSEG